MESKTDIEEHVPTRGMILLEVATRLMAGMLSSGNWPMDEKGLSKQALKLASSLVDEVERKYGSLF